MQPLPVPLSLQTLFPATDEKTLSDSYAPAGCALPGAGLHFPGERLHLHGIQRRTALGIPRNKRLRGGAYML